MKINRALLPFFIGALILLTANQAKASDEPIFNAHLEPCGGRWIPVGAPLRLTLYSVEPAKMTHLDLTTLRLQIDNIDLLAQFPAMAATAGKLLWNEKLKTLTLEVPALLPPGNHHWQLSCRPASGVGLLCWGGAFHLYQPQRAKSLARRLAEGLGSASLNIEDFEPPDIETTPGNNTFIHTAACRLATQWTDTLTWVDIKTAKIMLNQQDCTASFTLTNHGAYRDPQGHPPLPQGKNTLTVQVKDALGNLGVASHSFIVVDDTSRSPWPFKPINTPQTIGHTHHQYQKYGGTPYFHHGVDIMPAARSPLYACRGGKVEALYWYGSKPYYFEVAIRDAAGFLWQYHHVDEPTVPQAVKTAFANKTPLANGAYIGDIVYWPASSYGKRFHHTHMNVLDADGNYVNPLHLMLKQKDQTKPVIYEILVAQNGSTTALNTPQGPRPVISGMIDIIARADDKDGLDVYALTTYRMDWGIQELTGTKSHHLPLAPLWIFDSLPGGSSRFQDVYTIFQNQIRFGGKTYYTSGDYNNRSFFYNLTNNLWGIPNPAGCWDTSMRDIWNSPIFPNGVYRITVRAMDDCGNTSLKTLDVEVKNP